MTFKKKNPLISEMIIEPQQGQLLEILSSGKQEFLVESKLLKPSTPATHPPPFKLKTSTVCQAICYMHTKSFSQCVGVCACACVCVSRSVVSYSLRPHGLQPSRVLCPWDFPGKNTGVDCYSLLQGIFLTQGSNLSLLHCRQILYHLNHQRSPVQSVL